MILSVVICTYNRGKNLSMVLDSMRNQNYPSENYEVVLVNNNSTDETAEVISQYQNKYPEFPLRCILETNQGISYARNRGVEESRGDVIVFIDDDETVDSNYLETLSKFYTDYPDACICAGPVVPVCEVEPPSWLSKYTLQAVTGAYDKGKQTKRIYAKDCPGTGHSSFRKSMAQKYDAFNVDLGRKGGSLMGAEDKDFFLRLMEGGEKMYYLPEAPIYHHIPASKLTEDYFRRVSIGIGKSERTRTLHLGKSYYYRRIGQEAVKWCATLVLWCGYALSFNLAKANKLVEFRARITKGLIKGI